jgi:hypothetical protein
MLSQPLRPQPHSPNRSKGRATRRRFRTATTSVSVGAFVSLSLLAPFSSVSAAETATARATFIAAADKVCQDSNTRLVTAAHEFERHTLSRADGAGSKKRKVAKPSDVREFIETVAVKELTNTLASLDLLQAPTRDRTTYRQLLTDTKKALAAIKAKPGEAAWKDPFSQVSKRYVAFGFQVCGHDIDTELADKLAKQK